MSGDTMQDSMKMLDAARHFAKQHASDGLLKPLASAYQLPFDVETLRKFGNTDDREWAGMHAKLAANEKTFGLSDKGAKAWQDLSIQFETMSILIKDKLAGALGGLVGPLTKLSGASADLLVAFLHNPQVKKGIDDLGSWLSSAAKTMGSTDFKKDVADFIGSISKISSAIKPVADTLGKVGEGYQKIGSFLQWIGLKAEAGQRAAWDAGTAIGQHYSHEWAAYDTQASRQDRLGVLEKNAGLAPGTLNFLNTNLPGEVASRALPFMDTGDFDQSSKLAAGLFRDELKKYGDSSAALAALAMGDAQFDTARKAHPKDWQKYASSDLQQLMSDFDAQTNGAYRPDTKPYKPGTARSTRSGDGGAGTVDRLYVPPGTGATIYVINSSNSAHVAINQLGGG